MKAMQVRPPSATTAAYTIKEGAAIQNKFIRPPLLMSCAKLDMLSYSDADMRRQVRNGTGSQLDEQGRTKL